MFIQSLIIFVAALSSATSTYTGLRLLFPDCHRKYIYVVKTNVSSGTLTPRESGSFWTLEGRLTVQIYDNYTKARLQLDGLKNTVSFKTNSLETNENKDEKYLTEPWELEYLENGYIGSIFVGEEPLWSINFKRALSINFQLTIKNYGTYSVNEPCLDNFCVMMYSARGNTVKKYTSVRVPNLKSGRTWSSVPWQSDFAGRLIIDSVSAAERLYEFDDDKGLMNLDLKGSYQYKTHDHILAVTSDLSLYYDTDLAAETIEKLNHSQTTINYVASNFTNPTNGIRDLSQSLLKNNTYEILLKIARKGIDADNIVRNPSLIHNLDFIDLLNTISRLDYHTLIKLFEDLVLGTSYDLETARNIFLEVLPHVRSEACARFIKYLVVEEKEKVEDAALLSLIRKLPFNVAIHSQSLLEELEVFTKLGLDFSSDIRHAGILSFATLVHKTMETSQVKQDYLDNIVVKYFRMYSDCPQYLDRMIWLQGLCNIGFSAESYTRIIYAESGRDRHERLWAALAGSPNTEEPYMVIEMTLPILTNETEHIQLRIASLHTFLSSPNIRESDFMFIHNYIKSSTNNQLKRFWFATIKNLEANKPFTGYRVASFYVPFVANQVSNPDPLYWATNNYIISAQEESAPSLQIISVGDAMGALPAFLAFKLTTGGRRPYKAAAYVVVEGVTTSVYKKLYDYSLKELRIDLLIDILKSMNSWKIKTPDKVHIDIVIKIHDKTVFASHMNQSRVESWNGEDLATSVEDFLRFGSHINQQIVYYPFQIDVHIPTELGTPIRLQSTILSFTSIRGNLTSPSNKVLTWRNDLHIRYQGTSITSLSTDSPLVQTLHIARIQQSLVAHLPMKFNVSFSANEKSLDLTFPNLGSQQGGIAMHSRAQIALETMRDGFNYTVTDGGQIGVNDTGIFFDCERPMTGAELLDKLLSSKTNNIDLFSSLQPSLIILNSILLFASPPSGSCGVILPPQRLMRTGDDVLQLKFLLKHLSITEEATEVDTGFLVNYYSTHDPSEVYLKVEADAKFINSDGNANLQVTLHGQQDHNSKRKDWTICLREQDISHESSDQDISAYPASYEGHVTLTYTGNQSACFESGSASELTFKYKGVPKRQQGRLERYFEVKVFGRNLSEMGILESDVIGQTALGQLLRSYNKQPLNVTAVIKEKNGLASISVNKGTEMQFKSDNFAWLLDSWTNMQIMKTFGFYRECRLQETAVQTLSGMLEQLPPSQCSSTLVLADCSDNTPRFAVQRLKDGSIKVFTGGYFILVSEDVDSKIITDESKAGNQFWTTTKADAVKIVSRLTDIEVYYRRNESVLLVPHFYISTVCGVCSNVHDYEC